MKPTYITVILVTLMCGLIVTSPAPRYDVSVGNDGRHHVARRSLVENDCVYDCGTEVYKCDLRCTYLRSFKRRLTTGQCLSHCGDTYIMCYVGCMSWS